MIGRHDRVALHVLPQMGLAVAGAVVASAAVVSIFVAEKPVVLAILGSILLIVAFSLAGNQRLFCLWGLLLSAPLALSKNFWIIEHMGGASALRIELSDLFIWPLLAFILRDYFLGYRQKLRFSAVAFWWGALAFLGMMNIVVGPMRHLPALEVFRMAQCYALFFVIINEVVRVRQFLHAFAALSVGMALQASIGIIQYVFKADLHLQVLGEALPEATKSASESAYNIAGSDNVFRISGLLGHPNLLSAYLAMLLPICLSLLFSRISIFYKCLVAGAVALGSAALVMTLSRSGWLSFGVAFLILFGLSFLHPRLRTRYLTARVAVIALLGLGLLVFSGAIEKRITESDPGSFNFRLEFMDIAWKMVEEAPVVGFGLNTFVFDLPGRSKYGGAEGITEAFGRFWPVVHNTYLIVWTEQGTVGFFFFIGLHLCVLWLAISSARHFRDDVMFTMNLGCLAGFVAIMIDGMSSFLIREAAPARVFWIVVALIVAINYWNKANMPGNLVPAGSLSAESEPPPSSADAAR
jgi:putative inorganic carbon (hco3(-)) transporter